MEIVRGKLGGGRIGARKMVWMIDGLYIIYIFIFYCTKGIATDLERNSVSRRVKGQPVEG